MSSRHCRPSAAHEDWYSLRRPSSIAAVQQYYSDTEVQKYHFDFQLVNTKYVDVRYRIHSKISLFQNSSPERSQAKPILVAAKCPVFQY